MLLIVNSFLANGFKYLAITFDALYIQVPIWWHAIKPGTPEHGTTDHGTPAEHWRNTGGALEHWQNNRILAEQLEYHGIMKHVKSSGTTTKKTKPGTTTNTDRRHIKQIT